MSDEECLGEWDTVAKEVVSMYRAVWVEVEHQFPSSSAEERMHICSSVFPFMADMFTMAAEESLIEDLAKTGGNRKRKR